MEVTLNLCTEPGTVMEKTPSEFVRVEAWLPGAVTVAPTTGCPFASVILPAITRVWAEASGIAATSNSKKTNTKCNFLILIIVVYFLMNKPRLEKRKELSIYKCLK